MTLNKEEWINNLNKGQALQLEIDPSVCLKQQKMANKAKFTVQEGLIHCPYKNRQAKTSEEVSV